MLDSSAGIISIEPIDDETCPDTTPEFSNHIKEFANVIHSSVFMLAQTSILMLREHSGELRFH